MGTRSSVSLRPRRTRTSGLSKQSLQGRK
jgi:hypothetical protein